MSQPTAQSFQPQQIRQEPQPPVYNPSSAQLNLTDIKRQQEELDKRAAELDERERRQQNPSSAIGIHKKNRFSN